MLGNGLLLGGDDSTGVNFRFSPVKGQSLFGAWVKIAEGDVTNDSADSDYYQLQYDMEMAGWKLSPLVGYLDGAGEADAWYLGASVAGKVGPVALAATVIGNDWDNGLNGAAAADGNGITALVNAKFSLTPATLLVGEFGYAGDSDSTAGQFLVIDAYNPFSEIVAGGRFDARGTVGTNTTVNGQSAAKNAGYYANYMYAKLGAEQKLSDAIKLSGYYIYAQEAEDTAARDAITYGHEIDAYADVAVVPGLTFTVGGGYLIADSDYGAGDDAWKVGTALTYKF